MKPKYGSLSVVVVAFVAAAIWLYINEKQQKDHLLQESLIFKDQLTSCSEIEIRTKMGRFSLRTRWQD